ncbi:acyl-CoA thioesterase II [Aggregatimonas sangjinii]|uniref:Acyl-CoA thioesterase 2 n=1 Tax=Aggregatimonas sangjinii TaxID=2583587 RepID=A0A5B7SSE3_9FLAO|nr:acyl-CoA thioesterase II [Aggregatimonas sangjinii]QCW99583.1 acyl-CoA thioesterase II [Aggregatimonas sangjinii]
MHVLEDLIALLTLKKVDDTIYEGENYQAPWGRVFGGQVLGQSLHAAYQTVPDDRVVHSLHGYFILGGDLRYPIRYEVDTIRNGGSFTTRRVVAKQNGKAIFNMAASFQVRAEGVDHQIPMPNLIPPEKLTTSLEQLEEIKETFPSAYHRLRAIQPKVFDFKPVEKFTAQLAKNGSPFFNIWLRTAEKAPIDLRMQHQLMAYASDYNLLTTATLPHREKLNKGNTFYASLDHAIWFHRDFDIQNWLLYSMDSPSASNSRGFARGSIFDRKGILVASVAQEGLMREQVI